MIYITVYLGTSVVLATFILVDAKRMGCMAIPMGKSLVILFFMHIVIFFVFLSCLAMFFLSFLPDDFGL